MSTVFLLQHSYEDEGFCEEVKMIGVYASREKAQAAIERLRSQPGFRDRPDGFNTDEYKVDQDNWAEGYVSGDDAADHAPASEIEALP
ncbi:MAG: hypothetical protein H8F28_22725 [Fibrella sp.]|nr:hypothetical protein [Armatimonadota bacterium]